MVISPGASKLISASTGAPSASARSEGSIEATKGTAVPTAAAPPAQALAMTRLRRALLGFEESLIREDPGPERCCEKRGDYTESPLTNQIFCSNPLIYIMNSGSAESHPVAASRGSADGASSSANRAAVSASRGREPEREPTYNRRS